MASFSGVSFLSDALEKRMRKGTDSQSVFEALAKSLSSKDMNTLSPNAKAAVMTAKMQNSFGPITNVLGHNPAGLVKRMAARGLTGAAEALSGKDGVGEAIDAYDEYIREIAEKVEDIPKDAKDFPKDILGPEQQKRFEEILKAGQKQAMETVVERKFAGKVTEVLTEAAKAQRVEEAKDAVETAAAKGINNLAQALITRSTGNERFRDRRDEEEGRAAGDHSLGFRGALREQRFRDIVSEQFIPGSQFARESGGLSLNMLPGSRTQKGAVKEEKARAKAEEKARAKAEEKARAKQAKQAKQEKRERALLSASNSTAREAGRQIQDSRLREKHIGTPPLKDRIKGFLRGSHNFRNMEALVAKEKAQTAIARELENREIDAATKAEAKRRKKEIAEMEKRNRRKKK